MAGMGADGHRDGGALGGGRMALLAVVGMGFWLAFALFIRFTGPLNLFTGDGLTVLMYALALPITGAVVWVTVRLLRLAPAQYVPAVALATMAAMFCDGLALVWAPTLYAADGVVPVAAGPWILWGAAAGILAAFVLERRPG